MRLSFFLLGDFQVNLDNQSITRKFRTDKERALLAYLVMEAKRPISRELLAEMFWPDRPEIMSRANLRQALLGVRNAIEDRRTSQPLLLVSDESIQLNPKASYWVDADTFKAHLQANSVHDHKNLDTCPTCAQQLQEAVDLYRQDFLTGLYVENSQSFQEWAFFHREQFKRYLLEILDHLSEIYKTQGDWETMQKYAWLYVKHAPLEEQAYRRLMELLALSGRRSAALEQYQLCVRMLQQELGVEPSAETVGLYERIRLGKPVILGDEGEIQAPDGLPRPMTEFIGREDELDYLARCLANPSCQLISINGLPGVGKSRLAIEAAQRQVKEFQDGLYYLSLDGVHSEELFYPALARSLGLTISLANPRMQIGRFLESKRCILLVDQFDEMHNSTHLLMDLLQNALHIKIIVTSRQRLNLLAANPLTLEGLPYPLDPSDSQALKSPAVQLFLKRARHSRQDLTQNPSWLFYVLELCQAVDGIPLALELAADRLHELSLPNIVDSLHKDLVVLSTSLHDVPARQRSMKKILTSVWEALDDPYQRQLESLSIFPCSFTPQAAEQICHTSQDTLTFFSDQSLLVRLGYGRYAFKPLIRQFAMERLASQKEVKSALQEIFGNHYLEYLHQKVSLLPTSRSPGQLLFAIDEELENIDYALDWAFWIDEANLVQQAVEDFQHYRRTYQTQPEKIQLPAAQHPAAQHPAAQLSAAQHPAAQPAGPQLRFLDSFSRQGCERYGTGCPHVYRLVDANNAMFLVDGEGQIKAANYQAQQLSGLPLGIMLGMNLQNFSLDYTRQNWQASPISETHIQHHSGALIAIEALSLPVRPLAGNHNLVLVKKVDFEAQRGRSTAPVDHLTGLPEGQVFSGNLSKAISDASSRVEQFGLLIMQIQGLANLEKSAGKEIYHQCIQKAAGRIHRNLRQDDFLARLGENEFGVIIERLPHAKALEIITGRLAEQFQTPFVCAGKEIKLGLSCGTGMYPNDGDRTETLLEVARKALRACTAA